MEIDDQKNMISYLKEKLIRVGESENRAIHQYLDGKVQIENLEREVVRLKNQLFARENGEEMVSGTR